MYHSATARHAERKYSTKLIIYTIDRRNGDGKFKLVYRGLQAPVYTACIFYKDREVQQYDLISEHVSRSLSLIIVYRWFVFTRKCAKISQTYRSLCIVFISLILLFTTMKTKLCN